MKTVRFIVQPLLDLFERLGAATMPEMKTALVHVQKLIPIIAWAKGVVPIREPGMFSKVELGHLCVGDLKATGVEFVQETTVDR
jgi:hypothetical protein